MKPFYGFMTDRKKIKKSQCWVFYVWQTLLWFSSFLLFFCAAAVGRCALASLAIFFSI